MLGRLSFKLALALLLAIGLVPTAQSAADPIGGGRTSFKLNKKLYGLLRANAVDIGSVKPGKVRGRTVTLPVSSGLLESTYGTGYLFYKGGIRLQAGERRVVLRGLLLNTEKDWLRGRIGATKLFIAKGRNRRARRDGFDKIAVKLDLSLTDRAASLLNRRLGLRGVFEGRRPLAAAATVATRDQVTVSGGTLRLAVDQGFEAKLQSVEVEVRPQESATQASSTPQTLALPLLTSFVAPDLSSGSLYSEAGLLLIREGSPPTQARFLGVGVSLDSGRISGGLWLDPSPPLPGLVGTVPIASVGFGPQLVQIDRETGSISAPGTLATLAPEAAARLNEAFAPPGESLFSAGEPFAAISFTAETR